MSLDLIWWVAAFAFAIPLLVSLSGTPATAAFARRRRMLDRPNDRSSHDLPTPYGGGIPLLTGVMIVLLLYPMIVSAQGNLGLFAYMPLLGAAVLVAVSWMDDLRNLPALPRLIAQAVVVIAAVLLMPLSDVATSLGLPLLVVEAAVVLAWVWFINLYNFMDGIDGITGIETLSIALGFVAVNALIVVQDNSYVSIGKALFMALHIPLAFALIGGVLGFLPFNWHPARIFLGDVGSVPLGFLVGWLIVVLASYGYLAAAIILPMYYVADSTITLFRRLLRGQRPWHAHREHYYQRATDAGVRHDRVSLTILAGNLGLIGCAAGSLWYPWLSVLAAALITLALMAWMATRRPRDGSRAAAP